jgi:hypothetical protein
MYLLLFHCVKISFSVQFSKIPITIERQEKGCIASLPAEGYLPSVGEPTSMPTAGKLVGKLVTVTLK